MEVWLRPNRRVLFATMVFPALLMVAGVLLAVFSNTQTGWLCWGMFAIGILSLLLGAIVFAMLCWFLRRPRVSYAEGKIYIDVRSSGPVEIPLDVVEIFFLGQGKTEFAGEEKRHEASVTVVTRLAEKATEYRSGKVNKNFGQWEDGYLIIRGIWCEPIDGDLVVRMNKQLAAAKRAWKEQE